MKGPDYNTSDLIFWGGLMGGTVVAYLLLGQMEWPRLLQLLLSLAIGYGLGWTAERLLVKRDTKPPSDTGPRD